MSTEHPEPKHGDWVQLWGKVTTADAHPEDVVVRLASHNEHYSAHVRRDQVVVSSEPPPFLGQCTALYDARSGMLWRCTRRSEHAQDKHVSNGGTLTWTDAQTVGHIEER